MKLIMNMKLFAALTILMLLSLTGCELGGGNDGGSDPGDNTNPVVNITNPVNGKTVQGTIIITAIAADDTGLSIVEFYIDDVKVGEDPEEPYQYTWNTKTWTNKSYDIKAIAYDNSGNSSEDDDTNIIVSNSGSGTADTTDPTVNITSPLNGATVSGTITITAAAQDNKGIDRVKFYIDNVFVGADSASPYQYIWDTTAVSDRTYKIKAIAYDKSDNRGKDDDTSITVDNSSGTDLTDPMVNIQSPEDGNTVSGLITIAAAASDNAAIAKVEFYINGTKVGEDSSYPYQYTWNTELYSDGTYAVKAIAYDTSSNTAVDDDTSVTVNNSSGEDHEVPVVNLTSPADGASISGTIYMQATATDNEDIDRVEFFINGIEIGEDSTYPYKHSLDTTAYIDGEYSLKVKAYDTSANTAEDSDTIIIIDNDTDYNFTFRNRTDGFLTNVYINSIPCGDMGPDDQCVTVMYFKPAAVIMQYTPDTDMGDWTTPGSHTYTPGSETSHIHSMSLNTTYFSLWVKNNSVYPIDAIGFNWDGGDYEFGWNLSNPIINNGQYRWMGFYSRSGTDNIDLIDNVNDRLWEFLTINPVKDPYNTYGLNLIAN